MMRPYFKIQSVCLMILAIVAGNPYARAEAGPNPSAGLAESIKIAVDRVTPALVRIHVVDVYYRDGREMKSESSGSGVVISPEGHIITNHHVAGHAKQLKCVFADKSEYEAELVGTDPLTDIAVIALKTDEKRLFPVVEWGDSGTVLVGDHVLAMGSPLALSQSVTLGIVSNTEMTMPEWMSRGGGLTIDGEDVGALVRWIAHDAQIFGGNSGGPLVNLQGEVIGINEIRMGLSGAIPGNLARSVAEEIIQTGSVRRAWVGLDIQPRLKADPRPTGALVSSAIPDSPAADAGLRSGDLLLSVNGQEIDIRFLVQMPDFNLLVAGLPIGEPATFIADRDGVETTFEVVPTERETYEPRQFENLYWGVTVRNISFMVAKEMKRDSTDGVLVTSVRSGGPAGDARPSISRNDVLLEIAGRPMANVNDFQEITEELMGESTEPQPVLAAFERDNDRFITVVQVGIRPLSEPGMEVRRAWLPLEYQVITRDLAESMGDPEMTGFRVTQVYPRSTAEEADLRVGDLILAVDDEKMTATSPEHHEELAALIRQYASGAVVDIDMQRDGERSRVPVTLADSPKLAREMKRYQDEVFEFNVRDITFFDRASEKWDEAQTGVLVEQVKPGGWAALGQLSVSDLIIAIDDTVIRTVDDVREKIEAVAEEHPRSVVFKIKRGIRTLYLELEPKWDSGENG